MRFTRFEDMLSCYAESMPDAPALRYEKNGVICTLTYAELAAAVVERRTELERSEGTCLGVTVDGSVECVLTLLAAPASGMRTVLLDATAQEETLKALAWRFEVDRTFADGQLKSTEKGDDPGKGRGSENSEKGELLFFTSGTTGAGRAVILTEQTLCASAYNGSAMLPLSPEDTLLCILPLNHVFGFVCGFLWGLSCGACVALGRGARHYIDDCAFFKPTTISAVPMLFEFLLKHSLLNPECKLVLVGAGDCPASLLGTAKAQGIRVSFGYGLTETSSGVAISVEGDPYAMAVCPDNEITIAEDGEILVKAPTCMMKGYAGEPEATAEVLRDEVLATGDLGYLDQDGKLHVTGRKKEMLVLADGTKLFLPEAEAELAALLGISDLAIVSAGEQPVLILGGNLEDRKTAAEITATSEKPIEKQMADRKSESSETTCEKETGEKTSDRIREEAIIWEKIRTFQDARPRGQQISAIRWYGKPLPRTATGKLKRWMLGGDCPKT